jgi:hypothetical protein
MMEVSWQQRRWRFIMLWSGFDSISIEHCNREANRVAHELARKDFS